MILSDTIDRELIEVVSREVARIQKEKLKKETHQKSVGRPPKKLYINKSKKKNELVEETLEPEVLEDELLKISQGNDVVEISNSDLHTFDEFVEGQEYDSEEIIEETNCSEEIIDDLDSSSEDLGVDLEKESDLSSELDKNNEFEADSKFDVDNEFILNNGENKKELSEEIQLDTVSNLSNNVLYNFEDNFSDMDSDFDDDDLDGDFDVSFDEDSEELLGFDLEELKESQKFFDDSQDIKQDVQKMPDESQSILEENLDNNKNNNRDEKKHDLSTIKVGIKDNNDCNDFEDEEFKDCEDDRFKDCIYYKGMPVSEFLTKNKNYRESFYVEHFYSLEELKPLLKRGEIFLKKGKYKH